MIAIVDAGPLYAAVDTSERNHERALDILSQTAYQFFIPALVIAEVVHFIGIRLDAHAEVTFIEGLADFIVESPNDDDWPRIVELLRQYHDFPLGTVDASVIALAERLNTDLIVTFDQRHFRAVRPRHVEAFRLLPD